MNEADHIADAFVQGRHALEGFDRWPGTMPGTLEEAYAIQARAIARWPDRIAGWKVGRISGTLAVELGEDRFLGPIFAQTAIAAQSGEIAPFPVIRGGFAAFEAELVARIGTPVNGGGWTRESCARLVAEWHIGVEIAGSPFEGINAAGPLATIAGFGNNLGLLLGPAVTISDPDKLEASVTLGDGAQIAGRADALPGGPLKAVAFTLNRLHAMNLPVEPGMLISTGAITGVHEVAANWDCQVRFTPGGVIACRTRIAGT